MANELVIIAAGLIVAGIAIGLILAVSVGIRREERRFREVQRRREERFFRTGEVHSGFLPQDAPDHLTWGTRRLVNLHIRREPELELLEIGHDLLV